MSKSIFDFSRSFMFADNEALARSEVDHLGDDGMMRRLERFSDHTTQAEDIRAAANAKLLMASQFGGSAMRLKAFVEDLASSPLRHLDFNQLVETGAAAKLIQMERQHPNWLDAIRSGEFKDVQSLDRKIEEIRSNPNALCGEWKQAQSGPVEQEAAHLLKSGADLLDAAAKSIQTPPAAPGPKR